MKRRKPGESGSSRVYNAGVRPTNKLSYTVPSPSEKVRRTKGLCPVRLGAVQRPAAEGQPRPDGPSAPQAAARGRGWRPPRPPRARKVTRREGSQPWPRGTLSAGSARGALRRRRLLCISSRAARAGAQGSPPRARHRPGRWTSTDPFTFSNNLRVHRATPILQMKGRAQRP